MTRRQPENANIGDGSGVFLPLSVDTEDAADHWGLVVCFGCTDLFFFLLHSCLFGRSGAWISFSLFKHIFVPACLRCFLYGTQKARSEAGSANQSVTGQQVFLGSDFSQWAGVSWSTLQFSSTFFQHRQVNGLFFGLCDIGSATCIASAGGLLLKPLHLLFLSDLIKTYRKISGLCDTGSTFCIAMGRRQLEPFCTYYFSFRLRQVSSELFWIVRHGIHFLYGIGG